MSDTTQVLSKDYIYELIKGCLVNRKVIDICSRYLKYEYLQTPVQKKIVKYIVDTYNVSNQTPTLGVINQIFSTDKDAKDITTFLAKLRDINVEKKIDQIIGTFEDYIKDVKFQMLYENLAELYNSSKQQEAYKLLSKEAQAITNFSVKDKRYVQVFGGYDDRVVDRERADQDDSNLLKEKCTTGIHELDIITKGGYKKGTSFLAMAMSGVGKSTYLRWVALTNARLGKKVVLFSGEDTEELLLTAFDAAWTGITTENLERGQIPDDMYDKIMKTKEYIQAVGGEIFVIPNEQFEHMTIEEAREILLDIIKIHGPIDMALFDYLEIMGTKGNWGKGESAERRRREDIANKITALAPELKIVTGTATQSTDVKFETWNDPDFKLTRTHCSEFKGVIKPFSYFITFNATQEEYQNEIIRIYCDKFRKHKAQQTIKIYQSRGNGRFYDSARTKQTFYTENTNATDD